MRCYPHCFHRLFEAQAAQHPGKPAVVSGTHTLSYSDLNQRANQLAHYLREAKVGPETLVAIYLDRSQDFVVAMLAVLKAGGAYLPLDPAYPKERLALMVRSAGNPLVLTYERLSPDLEEFAQRVIRLDALQLAGQPETDLDQPVSPDHLANVIYTSGSTGVPKGVMLTHRNLAHSIRALQPELSIKPQDVYLCSASFAFSTSRRQLILPLSQGATVVIATDEERKDPIAFCSLVVREHVTVVDTVPSFLRRCSTVLSGLEPQARRELLDNQLRLILTNSEPLLMDLPRTWKREFKHPAEHVHMYGISETTGIVALYRIPEDSEDPVVPIGRPLENTEVLLLTPDGEPVPDGEAGEICVASEGVARGYLRDSEPAQKKFISHPSKTSAVLFRTGDWGRRLQDGRYLHLGRQDQQIKIRGFRVELQEIEAALFQCLRLKDAAVITREVSGDQRLIAYLTPVETLPKSDEIRRLLRAKLPDYMLPSLFIELDQFPLLPNGKVDRAALSKLNYSSATVWRQPRTPEEEILCHLFEEVLSVGRVGIDDNFFELGGDSLLGTQLVIRLRTALGVELALNTLFDSPTVSELSALLENSAGKPFQFQVSKPKGYLPVSHPQRRLWFVDRLQGKTLEYHRPKSIRLRGTLDREALEKAVGTIIERHESLRTHFAEVDGEPVQVIDPPGPVHLPVEDLSALDEVAQRERVAAVLREEWDQPFDLLRGPVWRLKLLKLGEQEHLLVRNLHHIVTDVWSEGLFFRELAVLYNAHRDGLENPLPPLAVQYSDFALWQNEYLSHGLPERLAYWKQQLSGTPERLALPTDRPRPSTQTFEAGEYRMTLTSEQLACLKSVARKNHATLYMTLTAAFGVLLARYSGQDDIVVGSPIANRPAAQFEELIGLFVNILLMRLRPRRESSFEEFLKDVRRTALEAYQHKYVPFELLVEELAPHRGLDATPLFQVMFGLHNAPTARRVEMNELRAEPLGDDEQRVRFDLEVYATEQDGGLSISWLFKRELFDVWRIEQMARHYARILDAVSANPAQCLSEIDLLDSGDYRLLEAWNATARAMPENTLARLFEAQAASTPDRIAARCGEEHVTYRDLNQRANQLAHHLRNLGVGPENLVGICLERSLDLLVALLGVLKAGGAYVPLDPSYPPQRLTYIAKDAQLSLVLTHSRFDGLVPVPQIICLDRPWPGQDLAPNPTPDITPDSAAYVIYTSGSTGQPKGIVATHRGAVNRLAWMWERYPYLSDDVCCAKTSLNFVDSVSEIFGPLLQGVPLIIVSDAEVKDTRQLVRIIQAHKVTRIVVVPSLLRELLWMMPLLNSGPTSLRIVVSSGEALPNDVAQEFVKTLPTTQLLNLYGSSEVAGDVTAFEATRENLRETIPIGRPISNTQIHIVDQSFKLVPVGVPGELLVGGANLARGYWNRADLTEQKFIPDRFSAGNAESKLYRTGDLARWLPEGNIEYVGRSDHQVKIHGFRIELGEIEAALRSHPRVADALVIVHGEGEERRLVSYVIPSQGATDTAWKSQVEGWERVWTSAYREGTGRPADFNVIGWNSSYSEEPIPASEMRLWVDETVERLQALKPKSVLEIGCGTGLLLTRLAAKTQRYVGLDFSADVLDQLRGYLGERPDLSHVELRQGLAHDLAFLSDDSVDLVILNSVVQYFPGVDYLLNVLEEALRVTRRGGHVFVGDVRSLPLLEAYETSVQLHKAAAQTPLAELRRRIALELRNEAELVLDPGLFEEWARRKPKCGRVQTSLKTRFDNELSRFRLDVLMNVGDREILKSPSRWLSWDQAGAWRDELKLALAREPGSSVGVRGIQNRCVGGAVKAVHLLYADELQDLQQLRAACTGVSGEDPAAVSQLAQTLGATFCWQGSGNSGVYDVVFNPQWLPDPTLPELPLAYYRRLANTPVGSAGHKNLGQQLRDYLIHTLPDYMVPARIIPLDAFPLTPNGKVDRRSLPAPDFQTAARLQMPGSRDEEVLCALFSECLRAEHVGVEDNFFELGGHSLLAAKLLFRVEREFGIRLTLASIFLAPTPRQLAAALRRGSLDPSSSEALSVIPFQPLGDGVPMFWINPGYEGARLARHLGEEHPLYGIPIPPSANPTVPRSTDEMAAECVRVVRNFRPDGPYVLGGWCASGVIALEMARQLEQQGCEVPFVAMLDARSFYLPPMNALRRAWVRFWQRSRRLVYVSRRWPQGLLSRFRQTVKRQPPDPLPEQILAMTRHQPRPWAGRMVHIWASDWPHGRYFNPEFGWGHLAPNGFVFHEIPSDHLTLIQEPAIQTVAHILTDELDRADRKVIDSQSALVLKR